ASAASDGTDSPAGLVRRAGAAGLSVLALTDHDTTGGWADAVAALPPGLTLLRGAELSCVSRPVDGAMAAVDGAAVDGAAAAASAGPARGGAGRPVTLHLLGYLFDPADPAFVAERQRLRASRLERGRRIVELLQADGY